MPRRLLRARGSAETAEDGRDVLLLTTAWENDGRAEAA